MDATIESLFNDVESALSDVESYAEETKGNADTTIDEVNTTERALSDLRSQVEELENTTQPTVDVEEFRVAVRKNVESLLANFVLLTVKEGVITTIESEEMAIWISRDASGILQDRIDNVGGI